MTLKTLDIIKFRMGGENYEGDVRAVELLPWPKILIHVEGDPHSMWIEPGLINGFTRDSRLEIEPRVGDAALIVMSSGSGYGKVNVSVVSKSEYGYFVKDMKGNTIEVPKRVFLSVRYVGDRERALQEMREMMYSLDKSIAAGGGP